MEIKKIIDLRTGEERDIGGQEYTAGEGIKIENGVISVLGGSSKLYRHDITIDVSFENNGVQKKGYLTLYSSKNTMTQEEVLNYIYQELVKKQFASNYFILEGKNGSSIERLIISNNYYGNSNMRIEFIQVYFPVDGLIVDIVCQKLQTSTYSTWEEMLAIFRGVGITTTEV